MGMSGGDPTSIKAKIIGLISAVRMLMRSEFFLDIYTQWKLGVDVYLMVLHLVPLIGINTLIILYELILG